MFGWRVAVAMKNDSKRCPIEPSLTCDIVNECNPLVSDSDVNDLPRLPPHLMYGSDVYVISPRCPYLKSGALFKRGLGKEHERERMRRGL